MLSCWLRTNREMRLVNILWDVMLIQIIFLFDIQVRGIIISIGIISFSIEEDLSFARSLYHMSSILVLVGRGLGRLHMLQIQVG